MSHLQATYGGWVSPETGEGSAVVDLRNLAGQPCWLRGYPLVDLLNGARPLPFRWRDGGQYIFELPTWVRIGPGGSAHFEVAKYRCDTGLAAAVTGLRFRLAGGDPEVLVGLPNAPSGPRLTYCHAYGGAADSTDPGNTLQIGPIATGLGGIR